MDKATGPINLSQILDAQNKIYANLQNQRNPILIFVRDRSSPSRKAPFILVSVCAIARIDPADDPVTKLVEVDLVHAQGLAVRWARLLPLALR